MKKTQSLLLTLVVIAGCGPAPAPAEAPPTATVPGATEEAKKDPNEVRIDERMLRDLRVTTTSVEERSGEDRVTLLGELAVNQDKYAEVGPPLSARVSRLLASVGTRVRRGQAVIALQSPEVGRARSEYFTASARLGLAESTLKRKRELAAERIAPLREVQEAENEVSAAKATLRAASTSLAALGLGVPEPADTESMSNEFLLTSPIDGVVIERVAVLGQMIEPNAAAIRIGDLSTLWLTVHAFERDAVRVRQGAPARISFSALPAAIFDGRIAQIGHEVSTESRTVAVRIDVANTRQQLRPGMSATAIVPMGGAQSTIIAVPVVAVQRVGNEWCVFVPKGTGLFEIRKIGRGRDLGTEVEVLSGLKAGDTVVVEGAFVLKSQAEKSGGGHKDHGGQP